MKREHDMMDGEMSIGELARVLEACAQYQLDWDAGREPRVESYLGGDTDREQRLRLQQLIKMELSLRSKDGNNLTRQEYQSRFPEELDLIEQVFEGSINLDDSLLITMRSISMGEPSRTQDQQAPDSLDLNNTRQHRPSGLGPTVTARGEDAGQESPPSFKQESPESRSDPDSGRPHRYRLIRQIGEGGFGKVFLAFDEELTREVAIKVPRPGVLVGTRQVDLLLREARVVAKMRHPTIVAVYDVGRGDDGSIFVVLEYIEGQVLSRFIKRDRLPLHRLIKILLQTAEAVHYAHKQGLIHRDLKPANILVDTEGNPHVTDFGLALAEDFQRQRSGEVAGTPGYMAPEQVRGENHRIDPRTDVWALGVILYQMLTGRAPFTGGRDELNEEILYQEPRAPHLLDDSVPPELERIALKCLSKRMSARYRTATELARDLREWIGECEGTRRRPEGGIAPGPHWGGPGTQALGPEPANTPLRVVPKGLRSFDSSDASFYLGLLPGPFDRDGLPESIRFWKTRIDEMDPDETFSVGLLYGPSGCGKSSLVKAGLIPHLAPHVRPVYLEASQNETGVRILRGLRKARPELVSENSDLVSAIRAIRESNDSNPSRKLVIFIDQFEQWLQGNRADAEAELVQALRQCDGQSMQCLVMVRDDFGMAAMRFLNALEVTLIEGRNYGIVDRFDRGHAVKLLGHFGRAFGQLPRDGTLSSDQARFLEQAVQGMSEDDKVVSVRLALFAEMFRSKPWTPASLRTVGGAEGIGVAFLEESLGDHVQDPRRRMHRQAAQNVLKALLPKHATAIKGSMRARTELVEASGYINRIKDFEEVMELLRKELRLIMPGDPDRGSQEVSSIRSSQTGSTGEPYYQLTHDYLVPSLKKWLTHKQRQSMKGRTELMLEDRANLWSAHPGVRLLPNWWEWASILLVTPRASWSLVQKRMMRQATRHYSVRMFTVALAIPLLSGVTWWVGSRIEAEARRSKAGSLVTQLLTANATHLPSVLNAMRPMRALWESPLKKLVTNTKESPVRRTRAHLALVSVDPTSIPYLIERLQVDSPAEHLAIRTALRPWASRVIEPLWSIALNEQTSVSRRFQAACALSEFDPANPRWRSISQLVARNLISANPLHLELWAESLKSVQPKLIPEMVALFSNTEITESERTVLAGLLAEYLRSDVKTLADLALVAEPRQLSLLLPSLADLREQSVAQFRRVLAAPYPTSRDARIRAAKMRANAVIALIHLSEAETGWSELGHSRVPDFRTELIHRVLPFNVSPQTLAEGLRSARNSTTRYAMLLALGGVKDSKLQAELVSEIGDLYVTDPDSGVHSAAAWVLRQWGWSDRVDALTKQMAGTTRGGWSVNRQGHTLVIIPGPSTFLMGRALTESKGARDETTHREKIDRSFAVGAYEVDKGQFQEYLDETGNIDKDDKFDELMPVAKLTWFDAIRYCRWLSEKENIPDAQMCYPPLDQIGPDMKLPSDFLKRTGYRLLTEAEWELSARAWTDSRRAIGDSVDHLNEYEWFTENSSNQVKHVGLLRPNRLGLFDTLGNVSEWCHDPMQLYPTPKDMSEVFLDEPSLKVGMLSRVIRGESFRSIPEWFRSARRDSYPPDNKLTVVGFRLARTVQP